MKNNSSKRLEILLWLAVRQFHKGGAKDSAENESSEDKADKQKDVSDNIIDEKKLPVLFGQLSKGETDKLKSLLADYNNKSAAERENWKKKVRGSVGTDEKFLDESVHWSHIGEALKKEPASIRRIIFNFLPESDKTHLKPLLNLRPETNSALEINKKNEFQLVSKAVRKVFAEQFTSLKDLQKPSAFDRLNGTQIVRLIRLAGLREVTFACARIEAVETVAAFLKRFPVEAARAIATQLNNLPQTSDERISFAEGLVQKALEIEPQPSAMLDMLGIWLIGIRICESPINRIGYTQQKLPREFAPELPEIIETQCRKTPSELQKQVSAEIEQLSETIIKTTKPDSKLLKVEKALDNS